MSALTCVAEIAQAVNEFDMYGMEYPDTDVYVNSTVPEWIYGRDISSFRKKTLNFIYSLYFENKQMRLFSWAGGLKTTCSSKISSHTSPTRLLNFQKDPEWMVELLMFDQTQKLSSVGFCRGAECFRAARCSVFLQAQGSWRRRYFRLNGRFLPRY